MNSILKIIFLQKKVFAAAAMLLTVAGAFAQKIPTVPHILDQLPPAMTEPASNYTSSIVIDSNAIWLGSGKGPSVSYDGGKTWYNLYNDTTFGTEEVSNLTIGRVPGNKIIIVPTWHIDEVNTGFGSQAVGTGSGLHYRFFYGSDTNWHSVSQPLDNVNQKTIGYGNTAYSFFPAAIIPQDNYIWNAAVTPSGKIFIASFAGGLRESTNFGATWQTVVLPTDSIDFLTPDSVYTNLQINVDLNYNQRPFSVVALSDSDIFVGTAGGIDHSTDGGVSWRKYNHNNTPGIVGSFIYAMAQQNVNGAPVIWATTIKSPIDTTVDSTNKPDSAIAFSQDDGATWHSMDAFHGRFTNNFGFLGKTVYVCTDTGLYSSCDGGQSWDFKTLFKDPTDRQQVLANPVYATAARLSDSLLLIGTGDGLVTTKAMGCYESSYDVIHVSAALSSSSDTYAYPNPFSPAQNITRIHYRIGPAGTPMTGLVTIEIFDFGMNPVRTLVRNAPRTNDSEWDEIWDGTNDSGSHIANGVYLYSVRVNSGSRVWGKVLVIQ